MGNKKVKKISWNKFSEMVENKPNHIKSKPATAQSNSAFALCMTNAFFRKELFQYLPVNFFSILKLVCKEFNENISSDLSIFQV